MFPLCKIMRRKTGLVPLPFLREGLGEGLLNSACACQPSPDPSRKGGRGALTEATRINVWQTFVGIILFGFLLSNEVDAADSPKLDPAVCRQLVKHTPAPDVAYQPGVDVHGHYVAPADVGGAPQPQLPAKIQIPLTLSLAKVLNLNTSQYPYSQLGPGTEAQLGTITVEGNHATLNGQPLSDEQQDNLAVLCMTPDR
jgi:hypothetical protein